MGSVRRDPNLHHDEDSLIYVLKGTHEANDGGEGR